MSAPTTIFFLPFAGGSHYSYASFLSKAPSSLRLFPIELPGRGQRFNEPLLFDLETMVDDVMARLTNRINQPYAIYGHSLGALLGIRLAQRLITSGAKPPVYLFFSGRAGPSIPYKEQMRHRLPRAQFWEKIRDMGGSPPEILANEELMDFFEPVLRADIQTAETFQYQAFTKVDVPIDVFIGSEEDITLEEALTWQTETKQPVEVLVYPGRHFFIYGREGEMLQHMSEKITKKLAPT